ncbi:hypothetical protein H6776_01480 [Candidatus Nomurabacteria bacterium]|nr:hypothetical protein [Candidatus Nomurabacteria bacterium]
MFSTKPRQSKTGMKVRVRHHDESIKHEMREMFIGHHTIFSLIGLAIGGTLVGKTLWEWLAHSIGLPWTFAIGLAVFALSGLVLQTFDDDRYTPPHDEDIIDEVVEL